MRTFGFVLSVFALGACAHIPIAGSPAQSDWDRTLPNVRQNVADGNYFVADKLLDEYVRVHPATREAREAALRTRSFRRGLLRSWSRTPPAPMAWSPIFTD